MVTIAICDDDANERKQIEDLIDRWSTANGISSQVAAFDSGEKLLDTISGGSDYDLYLLDVLMPEINGIDLGKRIRTYEGSSSNTPIIYLTSSVEYAIQSYEIRAFYYLLKPVSYELFDKVISEAVQQADKAKSHIIPVRTKAGTYPVTYDEICYVILEGRSLTFLCFDRTLHSMTIPGSFKSAIADLAKDPRFFLCGASLLINLEQIQSIDKCDVNFFNDVVLPVPRNTAKPLYKSWLDFWLE